MLVAITLVGLDAMVILVGVVLLAVVLVLAVFRVVVGAVGLTAVVAAGLGDRSAVVVGAGG